MEITALVFVCFLGASFSFSRTLFKSKLSQTQMAVVALAETLKVKNSISDKEKRALLSWLGDSTRIDELNVRLTVAKEWLADGSDSQQRPWFDRISR